MSDPPFASCHVVAPVHRPFTYAIPEEMAGQVVPGAALEVPFGGRTATAFCVELEEDPDLPEGVTAKPIRRVLTDRPPLRPEILELADFVSRYYLAPPGEVLAAAFPSSVRGGPPTVRTVRLADEEAVEAALEAIGRRSPYAARAVAILRRAGGAMLRDDVLERIGAKSDSWLKTLERHGAVLLEEVPEAEWTPPGVETLGETPDIPFRREAPDPTDDQARALDEVLGLVADDAFGTVLLHGVTGSGKTEVYLRAAEAVLERGRSAIILVPEIALTPQTVRRFRDRLPGVAVLHSGLGTRARSEAYWDAHRGDVRVVIGPRSAVFAPVRDLGLVVVDEEHEPSYKQESTPRYHGRDVAIVRARLAGAPCVLGSATPALETFANARRGKYVLCSMTTRATGAELPPVEIVDHAEECRRDRGYRVITTYLENRLRKALAEDGRAILFLNRRGFSTYVHCRACGEVCRCSDCDITLTFHRRRGTLVCHYCGHRREPPQVCPGCGTPRIAYEGTGTERVADLCADIFEGAGVERFDSDAVRDGTAAADVLERFVAGDVRILVGTQIVAKGLDIPEVNLVGVVSADAGLHFPDFRAAERTFQLLCQVAGRTGRVGRGRVVFQTFQPEHYAIRTAAEHDYGTFTDIELDHREALGYPPFGHLARLLVEGEEEAVVQGRTEAIAGALTAGSGRDELRILGPAPCPIAFIERRHRWHVILKSPSRAAIGRALRRLPAEPRRRRGTLLTVDVDPVGML